MNQSNSFVSIVSGLPRSGTSMMMRMLDLGGMPVVIDDIRTADDDNPRGYYEFEPVKQTKEDSSWVKDAVGKGVKMVYSLLYDLPAEFEYRVLFMRRSLDEVLASQQVMLDRQGMGDGGANDDKMRELFVSQLTDFEKWIAGQPNFRMIEVNYNQMLEDPQLQVPKINDFLGGQLDTDAMLGVVDPSLYRNRR